MQKEGPMQRKPITGHGSLIALTMAMAALLHADETGELIRLERPVGMAELGACTQWRGVLSLPHRYTQGPDGRVVLEAEDATVTNIGQEGTAGPFSATERNTVGLDRRASLERYVAFCAGRAVGARLLDVYGRQAGQDHLVESDLRDRSRRIRAHGDP
jgi:hypothetical protein